MHQVFEPKESNISECTYPLPRWSCKKVKKNRLVTKSYCLSLRRCKDGRFCRLLIRAIPSTYPLPIAIYVWIPRVLSMSKLASQRPDWWGEDRLADVEVLWYARIGPRPINRGHTRRGDILRGISFPVSSNDVVIVIMIVFPRDVSSQDPWYK